MSSRQTRARGRAGGASSPAGNSNSQQGAYHDPPSADLPGLYPVHDGSYGVNTHINIDSISRRRGTKSRSGAVNEDEDDRRFNRRMLGREGKRYGMEIDLKKVVKKTKKEAKKDQDKHNDEDEEPDPDPIGSVHGDDPPQPDDPRDASQPETQLPKTKHQSGEQQAKKSQRESQTQEQPAAPPGKARTLNDDNETAIRDEHDSLEYQMKSHLPGYRVGFPNDTDDREKPPYTTVGYRSPDPYSLINNRKPSAAPLTQASSFYGTPTGLGSSLGSTAFRPSSSRSFNAESALYGNATLRTPVTGSSTAGANANGSITGNNPNPNPDKANGNGGTDNANPNPDTDNNPWATPEVSPSTASEIQFGSDARPDYGDHTSTNNPQGWTIDSWRTLVEGIPGERRRLAQLDARKIMEGLESLGKITGPRVQKSTELKGPPMPEPPKPPNNNPAAQGNARTGLPGVNAIDFGTTGTNMAGFGTNQRGQAQNRGFLDDDADDEDDDDDDDDDSEYEAARLTGRQRTNSAALRSNKNPFWPSRRPRGKQSSWKLGSWNFWSRMILIFLALLTLVWGMLTLFSGGLPDFPTPEGNIVPSINIPSWHDVVDGVCGVIPCKNPIPAINWGSDKSLVSGKSGVTQSELLEGLTSKIPEEIFVEQDKNGKLKITQDFWHALRKLIKEDDVILTLETAKKNAPDISDANWLAIKSRLERGGFGAHPAPTGASKSWDNWVKQNQASLRKMIGGIAIPRDEFMTLFTKEMQSYQKEIRKELMAQDARIKELIDTVAKLQNSTTGSNGLTREEVKAISDAAVRRAIKNAELDAVATGCIREHANDMFANQINFFSIGSGAVIDSTYTSEPWKPSEGHFKFRSENWYKRDGYVNLPPTAAISPWTEEGECYCSGRVVRGEAQITNAISLDTSRDIIPQHLVVEHILPGSTLDPGSMPKDIEVWAYIEEVTLRDEVRAFSESHFPTHEKEKTLNEGYVKIGHFVYESKNYGDGIQIFKMSDELANMKASTRQIVVRAVSNYGSDRTCFYRLRLYGDVVETTPWAEWNGRE
ncbi:hypothetical protein F5Y06DRAFT_218981 [Hypoxylon sp. FL0890]|nr:hypothetical protein F5Y06DRAFT_218981 [Hypoxylon sp. FL0890]